MMTTTEAAAALDITRRQVVNLIKAGKLQATKPGRDWQVDEESVETYKKSDRKVGRPKSKNASTSGHIAHKITSTDDLRGPNGDTT